MRNILPWTGSTPVAAPNVNRICQQQRSRVGYHSRHRGSGSSHQQSASQCPSHVAKCRTSHNCPPIINVTAFCRLCNGLDSCNDCLVNWKKLGWMVFAYHILIKPENFLHSSPVRVATPIISDWYVYFHILSTVYCKTVIKQSNHNYPICYSLWQCHSCEAPGSSGVLRLWW